MSHGYHKNKCLPTLGANETYHSATLDGEHKSIHFSTTNEKDFASDKNMVNAGGKGSC
jgi:hypothetical protein